MTEQNRFGAFAPIILSLAALGLPWGHGALAQSQNTTQTQASSATPAGKQAERDERLKLAAEVLERLYKIAPEARKAVETGAGYAVFDITSIYAILLVGQKGKGLVVDNTSKKTTFMSSNRAGTGPGVGKQRVFQVFVFKNKGSLERFMRSSGVAGDVGASVSTGSDGMVRSFNPDIDIYQIPDKGFAVQASWGGTVYTADSDLN